MMNWARQQLANVTGTPEPIYGPSAIRSIATQAETTPFTLLEKDDVKWVDMESTSVETQTFYLHAESGHVGIVQVIHSNVVGLRRTSQFNTKIFYPKNDPKPPLWSADQLFDVGFSEDKLNFYASSCAIEISEDGKQYTVKSTSNENSIVNLTISQIAPGFQVGKDGKTLYGTNMSSPWGSMRHTFWPRNKVEGLIVTKDGPINFKGLCLFVHALQGMKPHHAAAKWNFVNFQGTKYTAIMMEFTTPKSYGSTTVNVGGIVHDNEITMASASNIISYTKVRCDEDNKWLVPESAKYEWIEKTDKGEKVQAVIEGSLGERPDRIDVMAEVPVFVKQIVAGAVGTKPYIYQFIVENSTLSIKNGEEVIVEEGQLFTEASFISE
ncbi:unnamed protein product [Blumeria hordei]|uniref:Survival factor 1 n=1 Tax=Blumeria hordei TaxID=2867405 RepID=A0A383UIE4_BLUHO|nr:unnamed protein product [Blumeria hordei]